MKELLKKIDNGLGTFVTVVFVILMIIYASHRFIGPDIPKWPKSAIYMSNDGLPFLYVQTWIEDRDRMFRFKVISETGQEAIYEGMVLSYDSDMFWHKTYMTLKTTGTNLAHAGKEEVVALVLKDDYNIFMEGFWGAASVQFYCPPGVTPVEF